MAGNILLVEGDPGSRELLGKVLAGRPHHIVEVESAARALEEAARAPFDLVISGMALSGGDGLSLAARLRERDADQELILLGERQESHAQALRAGVSECLLAPVDPVELGLAVDRCLERVALRRERARLRDENLELARTRSIHERCLELLSNLDIEWLQERMLADLTAVSNAQSAAAWIASEHGELALKAYRGLLDRHLLPERLEPSSPLVARMAEGTPWITREGASPTLWMPLITAGESLGLIQLSDPLSGEFQSEAIKAARTLVDFAAVAVKNGRRVLTLQRLGLMDRDTAAYNLSYFVDYASKEIYKARRYGRSFSLLTFSIDHLPQVRARLGVAEAKRAARGVIRALSQVIRDSDVIAKASEQEFYVLLPETDFFGSMGFARRAMAAVREEPELQELESRLPLGLAGGAATYPKDGDDFDELIYRCRRRMDERRASLQRRLLLDGLGFWEQVELLLGSPESPPLPVDERAEPSRRGKVADELFEDLQAEIARDMARDPTARGVLYVGCPEVRAGLPIAVGLESLPQELALRVYVLGRRADLESHPLLTPVFLEGDERMARHQFILWLSEHAAYALIQRRGMGATWAFHTSDTALVDGLISRLQAEYDLQPY